MLDDKDNAIIITTNGNYYIIKNNDIQKDTKENENIKIQGIDQSLKKIDKFITIYSVINLDYIRNYKYNILKNDENERINKFISDIYNNDQSLIDEDEETVKSFSLSTKFDKLNSLFLDLINENKRYKNIEKELENYKQKLEENEELKKISVKLQEENDLLKEKIYNITSKLSNLKC